MKQRKSSDANKSSDSNKLGDSIPPWSKPVAVAEVPETGQSVHLRADEATRAAIAAAAGLASLPRLEAGFELTRHSRDGVRVTGHVSATIGQNCVVTLEPVQNEIDEPVDLVFIPASASPSDSPPPSVDDEDLAVTDDPPEVLRDGFIDLGALATEFLLLGIDPYPRAPGAKFDSPPVDDPAAHPFAALAALKKDRGENGR